MQPRLATTVKRGDVGQDLESGLVAQSGAKAAALVYGVLLAVAASATFYLRSDPVTWGGVLGFTFVWPVLTAFAGLAWSELVPAMDERESRLVGAGLACGGVLTTVIGAGMLVAAKRSGARVPAPVAVAAIGGIVAFGRGFAVLCGFGRTAGNGVLMLALWLVFPLILIWV